MNGIADYILRKTRELPKYTVQMLCSTEKKQLSM